MNACENTVLYPVNKSSYPVTSEGFQCLMRNLNLLNLYIHSQYSFWTKCLAL